MFIRMLQEWVPLVGRTENSFIFGPSKKVYPTKLKVWYFQILAVQKHIYSSKINKMVILLSSP